MKRVISFKVDDKVYNALKKIMKTEKVSFGDLFNPLAKQIAQSSSVNSINKEYTTVYSKNSSQTYIMLVNIQKALEKIIKTYEIKKET